MSGIRTSIELQDNFSDVLDRIVQSANVAVSAMGNLEQAMNANINTTSLSDMRNEIDSTIAAVDALQSKLQNTVSPTVSTEVNPVQQPQMESQSMDVSGVQNYTEQVEQMRQILTQVSDVQQSINAYGKNLDVIPEDEREKIQSVNADIEQMNQMLEMIENNPFDLPTEAVEQEIVSLINKLRQTAQEQLHLNDLLSHMDIEVENPPPVDIPVQQPDPVQVPVEPEQPEPVTVPVQWESDNLEVFTSTGVERFQQEVASANRMLEQLGETQASISSQAMNANIFPPEAVQDLNNLAARMDAVRDRIQQIANNPLNAGTDAANAGLEQLRAQLDSMIQTQNRLNQAMQNMDVAEANTEYIRLSQTVGQTERNIRDNVNAQGAFNQEIQEGATHANSLTDSIKGMVAAYATIQTVQNVLNISDELTTTTARLDMMNDRVRSTDELVKMVYASAQDARGEFAQMASVVARFGNNAKDAFNSTEEVVAFANLIQKQMTIAGASTEEANAALLQLSQGLGSGVLRGEELNSVFEQAPNIIQSIADYLEVPIGEIRNMAAEGQLTADVVRSAIFAAADDINAKFEAMPMTWGQIWTSFTNTAMMAFQPVLQRLNDMANSEAFQAFVNGAIQALATLANIVLDIFDLIGSVGSFVAENWSIISPIVYGVIAALATYAAYLAIVKGLEIASAAATAVMTGAKLLAAAAMVLFTGATWGAATAQLGLNAALYACPIVWIIVLIIALIAVIYTATAAVNQFAGTSVSATGIIMGAFATLGAFILNIFILVWNFIASFVEFLVNVWSNPQYAIQAFIVNIAIAFLSFCLSLVTGTQSAIGVIVGIWYAFVQAIQNIIVLIWNFIAAGIEAIVNGWNSGIYQVKSFFVTLASTAMEVASSILSSMGSAASGIANMFVGAINTVIGAINTLISALNVIPGIDIGQVGKMASVNWDFGASAIADTASSLKASLGAAPTEWKAPTLDLGSIGDAYDAGKTVGADLVSGMESSISGTIANLQASIADKPSDYWEAPKFDYINLSDAASAGYEFGQGVEEEIGNLSLSSVFGQTDIPNVDDYTSGFGDVMQDALGNINDPLNGAGGAGGAGGGVGGIGDDVGSIADNTGAMADSMDISSEELKYLRDIAEQEAVNRYTVAEINIDQSGMQNNITSGDDIDGFMTKLTDSVNEAVDSMTEGVHE